MTVRDGGKRRLQRFKLRLNIRGAAKKRIQCWRSLAGPIGIGVFPSETFHATGGVDKLLRASVIRMACRTDIEMNLGLS